MNKRDKNLLDEQFSERPLDEFFDNAQMPEDDTLSSTKPSLTAKHSFRFKRPLGIILIAAAILGLIFFAPMLQEVPFIATARAPFYVQTVSNDFLLALCELPSIIWIVLFLIGLVLCFNGFSRRKTPRTKDKTISKTNIFQPNVAKWPAGLKPELANSAMERFNQHRNNCPDAFTAPPGIRMLMVVEHSKNKSISEAQEQIYHWTRDGDHYVIEIEGVIPGTMRFVMDNRGIVIGIGKDDNGQPTQIPMKVNTPTAVVRQNKGNETIAKCYLTLLGGN